MQRQPRVLLALWQLLLQIRLAYSLLSGEVLLARVSLILPSRNSPNQDFSLSYMPRGITGASTDDHSPNGAFGLASSVRGEKFWAR